MAGGKRRLSEFTDDPTRNQEYAGGLEQRPDNGAEPVVAQRQTLVLHS